MSFGFGLGSGLRALTAGRLGMQTAGNNISNANTPGYSRQRVDLAAALPYSIAGNLQIGTGVDVRGITRLVDEGLERRLQLQFGLVGAAELDQSRYAEIESVFGEPDAGLSNSFKDLFGAVDSLRTDPADRALRGGLIQAGNALGQGFRLVAERLGELGGSSFDEVRGLVRTVNERADAVARLNGQIISAEANGSDANDLRDTRSQHIKEMGKLLDVRAIERASGSVDLLVGGNLLVAGDRASQLAATKDTAGSTGVSIDRNGTPLQIKEGRIAALLRQEQGAVPGYLGRIDELARNTILEWNRIHTTGMPASGPFQSLTAAYGVEDGDGDGERGDELLSQSGFPFEVANGELYVSVTDTDTGAMHRTRIAIDPNAMSLRDVAARISEIDNLTASVDPTGRLRVAADDGYGFDFSPRLDPNPDGAGTFGGRNPSIGSDASGPFDLGGQTFPVSFTVSTGTAALPTTTTVTLAATDFVDPSAATVEELVAAINTDLGTAGTARAVGGRLVLQSAQGGSTSRLALANSGAGTALQALGLSTTPVTGRDTAVAVAVTGSYGGTDNQRYVFEPESDGIVGQTQNLRVRVLDTAGNLVTTLNVGQGYEPGKPLSIGNGIKVSFGAGSIAASAGQVFELEAIADSDTSDLLVASGMNSFFLGSSASDIAINPDLIGNPDRLAAAVGSATGDAGNLARIIALRDRDVAALDQNTIEDFYADLVGDIGFETAAANGQLQAQSQLLSQLQADREAVSGVNIDEEMVDMLRYQQSYEAAARFLSVAQEMTDTLINIGR
ncbi:MAG: flagellar hook-associated protein FlgK [Planctomycetes bacterium]|jgi:flagellar hook-associated protein FlgK|nr:flagellar hook-associated protein FlgK [Planctomycetota bacterium]